LRAKYLIYWPDARAGLRSAESQALLSELAACACIGLVASIDHVNAPLLWDKQARAACRNCTLPALLVLERAFPKCSSPYAH